MLKILLVDDSEAIRTVLKLGLSYRGGFIVEEASNGEEALKSVVRSKPDIILLDVTMPIMDGIQTYKRLKENPKTKHIPVIFISARPYEELIKKMRIGRDEYVEKPFEFRALNMMINKVVKSQHK